MEDINWKMFVAPIIILFIFIGGIIGIVNWQKSKQEDSVGTVEEFTVNLPEGEVRSEQKEIIVSGNADDADQVFINDSEVEIDSDGVYSKAVVLNEGENKIVVESKTDGEVQEKVERTVTYGSATSQGSASTSKEAPPAPSSPDVSAPASSTPASLATSGPEDIVVPIVGLGGVIVAVMYYLRSKKTLALNLRK